MKRIGCAAWMLLAAVMHAAALGSTDFAGSLSDANLQWHVNGDANDDDTGDANDAQGNYDVETTNGTIDYADTPGHFGSAKSLTFDGNDYLIYPDEAIDNLQTFTLCFWCKVEYGSTTSTQFLFQADSGNRFHLKLVKVSGNTRFRLEWRCNTDAFVAGPTYYDDGEPLFVCVVGTASGSTVYVNGEQQITYPARSTAANNTFSMGAENGGANRFEGELWDVRLYDRELTTAEMQIIQDGEESTESDVVIAARTFAVPTATGTLPLRIPGFGDENCFRGALLYGNTASSIETNADHANFMLGSIQRDGAYQFIGGNFPSGENPAIVGHRESNNYPYSLVNGSGNALDARATYNGGTYDGCELNVTDAPAAVRYLSGVFFGGDACQVFGTTIRAASGDGNSVDVHIPFEPALILIFSAGDQHDDSTGHTALSPVFSCFLDIDGTSVDMVTATHTGLATTSGGTGYVSDDTCLYYDPNKDSPNWEFVFTMTDTTTLNIESDVDGEDETPDLYVWALKPGTLECAVGLISSPASTGVQTIDGGFAFTPQLMVTHMTPVASENTKTISSAMRQDAISIISKPPSLNPYQACLARNWKHTATTDTHTTYSDRAFYMPQDPLGDTEAVTGQVLDVTEGGVTANMTAVGDGGYLWPFFAIEGGTADPSSGTGAAYVIQPLGSGVAAP